MTLVGVNIVGDEYQEKNSKKITTHIGYNTKSVQMTEDLHRFL